MVRRITLLALIFILAVPALGEQPIKIPLKQIWALGMPGTKDIRELDPDNIARIDKDATPEEALEISERFRASTLYKIQKALPNYFKEVTEPKVIPLLSDKSMPLETLLDILRGSKPSKELPADSDVMVVFYARPSIHHMRLSDVSRSDHTIRLTYTYDTFLSPDTAYRLALIPIGKCEPGELKIEVVVSHPQDSQLPPISADDASMFVSQSNTVKVLDAANQIDLGQIWAYRMPGTRELTDALRNDTYVSKEGPLVRKMRSALRYEPSRKLAKAGTIVVGTRDAALEQSLEYLSTEGKTAVDRIHRGEEAWILFFAYESGSYVHIEKVNKEKERIVVEYRFVPHGDREVTSHFALIPIGTDEPGKYRVEFKRLPLMPSEVAQGFSEQGEAWEKQMVSRPFSFQVTKPLKAAQ